MWQLQGGRGEKEDDVNQYCFKRAGSGRDLHPASQATFLTDKKNRAFRCKCFIANKERLKKKTNKGDILVVKLKKYKYVKYIN